MINFDDNCDNADNTNDGYCQKSTRWQNQWQRSWKDDRLARSNVATTAILSVGDESLGDESRMTKDIDDSDSDSGIEADSDSESDTAIRRSYSHWDNGCRKSYK